MANDGWERVATGLTRGGEPVYGYEKKGANGGLAIDQDNSGKWSLRYRVGNETRDGFVFRQGGIHILFNTLSEAKSAASRAEQLPPP